MNTDGQGRLAYDQPGPKVGQQLVLGDQVVGSGEEVGEKGEGFGTQRQVALPAHQTAGLGLQMEGRKMVNHVQRKPHVKSLKSGRTDFREFLAFGKRKPCFLVDGSSKGFYAEDSLNFLLYAKKGGGSVG